MQDEKCKHFLRMIQTTKTIELDRQIKFIAKIQVSVYRTRLQLQIDDYFNRISIKQFGGK